MGFIFSPLYLIRRVLIFQKIIISHFEKTVKSFFGKKAQILG